MKKYTITLSNGVKKTITAHSFQVENTDPGALIVRFLDHTGSATHLYVKVRSVETKK